MCTNFQGGSLLIQKIDQNTFMFCLNDLINALHDKAFLSLL